MQKLTSEEIEGLGIILWSLVVCSGLIGDKDAAPKDVMTTADEIVEGFNARFGYQKKGTMDRLKDNLSKKMKEM